MLGNWVYESERTRFPMQVVSIFDEDVYLDFTGNEGDVWEAKESDIMPIPLTEKIIQKFEGFEVGYYTHCLVYEQYSIIFRNNDNSANWLVSIYKIDNRVISKSVKYVHELQNIFKMYGIDLKIEL